MFLNQIHHKPAFLRAFQHGSFSCPAGGEPVAQAGPFIGHLHEAR